MQEISVGSSSTVAVVVDRSGCKSVEKGPIRGRVDKGWADRGLKYPKTPLPIIVVGDASYHWDGSVFTLILHHVWSMMMIRIDVARE